MIGIIQKVLLDLLEETGGKPLLGAVLKRAEVPENVTFRIDQNYSDDEFHRLLQASSDETGLSEDELSALYAKAFLKRARDLFPRFFDMSSKCSFRMFGADFLLLLLFCLDCIVLFWCRFSFWMV